MQHKGCWCLRTRKLSEIRAISIILLPSSCCSCTTGSCPQQGCPTPWVPTPNPLALGPGCSCLCWLCFRARCLTGGAEQLRPPAPRCQCSALLILLLLLTRECCQCPLAACSPGLCPELSAWSNPAALPRAANPKPGQRQEQEASLLPPCSATLCLLDRDPPPPGLGAAIPPALGGLRASLWAPVAAAGAGCRHRWLLLAAGTSPCCLLSPVGPAGRWRAVTASLGPAGRRCARGAGLSRQRGCHPGWADPVPVVNVSPARAAAPRDRPWCWPQGLRLAKGPAQHRVQGAGRRAAWGESVGGNSCRARTRPWGVTGTRGEQVASTSNKSPSGECCGELSTARLLGNPYPRLGGNNQDGISNHRQLLCIQYKRGLSLCV